MENNNKNNGVLIGILVGIIIMLLVVGGLYLTGIINFKEIVNINNEQNSNDLNKSIKIDNSKEYVYDAEYKNNNKYTEYDNGNMVEGTIDYYGIPISYGSNKLSALKVPYININSNDAQIVNKKLEELYLKYAQEFDKNIDASKQNGIICNQVLNYKSYQYNNILSIIVYDGAQCTSPFVFNYTTYNFDLENGKLLNYNEILSRLKLDSNTVLSNLKNNAKTKMEDLYNSSGETRDLTMECHYFKDENGDLIYKTSNCYDITYKLLQESIDNNNLLYFVDNNGDLNVMMILYNELEQNGDREYYLIKANK